MRNHIDSRVVLGVLWTIALVTLGVLLLVPLLVDHARQGDRARVIDRCLHESVLVYPAWSPGQPNVLDSTPACETLTVAEKIDLRHTMADFTTAYVNNMR
jgi:hypothetical protein